MNLATVVLAAGEGTRMRSSLPKVLHPIAGRAMVHYALDAARSLESRHTVVVVGYGADQVKAEVGAGVLYVEQPTPRGTGDAVRQTCSLLRGKADAVLVTYGDMPLLQPSTLQKLAELYEATDATIAMLTVRSKDKMGFGRIVRDDNGRVLGIVEESVATPEQKTIEELNCGVYCFAGDWLWDHLPQIGPSGKKAEYYLTDLVAMAAQESARVEAITLDDVSEVIGVNTRAQLAQAERVIRERINEKCMIEGVTLVDPAVTYIDWGVALGLGTVVEPNTQLKEGTHIGADCHIGPNAIIRASRLGDRCEVVASVIEESTLESDVHVGPFSHLRPGAFLARNVYVGNYVEIKNSHVQEGAHIGHLAYIGDSDVGARVNIGAGAITCNFDGEQKHRTIIGDDAFIGSDTMLVAPIRIGERAHTGAGTVVRKDVPPDSLAVGQPARVIRKLR